MIWTLMFAALAGPIDEGATAFGDGRLSDAITAWETARASASQPSGVLEFDLGTALYRRGDFPRAIARFRAAARLRPRDGNVQHNLAMARAELDGLPPVPVGPRFSWMQALTPTEFAGLGVLLVGVASALLVAARRSQASRLPGLIALVVGVSVAAAGVHAERDVWTHPVAVVLEAETTVRDAASINAGERHRLPAGTEVRVERWAAGFVLVEDARGRRGWVPSDAVEFGWAGERPAAG